MTATSRVTFWLRKLVRWFYFLTALALILLALIVQAGRSLSPSLSQYSKELSRSLSQQLNAKAEIGAISAEWRGLKPMLDVHDLRIRSNDGQPIIALQHAQMRLDLLGSLLHARLVWTALTLAQVEMDFVQTPDGFWHIPGIPHLVDANPADTHSTQGDVLLDMLLLSRRIEFDQTQLHFTFASGETVQLKSPLVRMENDGDFHRLTVDVDVDNHPKALHLVVEGKGDPRRRQAFSTKGFVQLNQFPTDEPVAAVTAFLLHGINAEVHSEGTLDANLWFKNRPQHDGFELVGHLGVERLSLPLMGHKLVLDSYSTDLVGHWAFSGAWHLALQNISANINQNHIEKFQVAASAKGFSEPLVLQMQSLDVEHLNSALDGAGVLGEGRLRDILRQLNPRGTLRNVEVTIPLQKPVDWMLRANLDKVAVEAWRGVPALSKVDGFVQAGQRGGFVDIDSHDGFSMHYFPTYAAPMVYDQVKGQVAWSLQPENNQIYVNSGALEFASGEERTRGYLWLALPWVHDTGDIDLYLQIGANHLNASQYTKYTPSILSHPLLDWLSKSIGPNNDGVVNQVGFVYRGSLNGHNHAARSHQVYLDVDRAELNYHPEWPVLKSVSGRVLIADDTVLASVDKAQLYDSQVDRTEVRVELNPAGHGSLLHVDGHVTGAAADGLRVLRESMLHQYIGASMDSWVLEGGIETQVNIAVPLLKDEPGAEQHIAIDLKAPLFKIGNLNLVMNDIQGHIHFNQDTGIASDDLSARLFGEPIRAQLSSKKTETGLSQTWVDAQGSVDSRVLGVWSHRPEALFLQGKIPYDAHIVLNHRKRESDGSGEAYSAIPFAEIKVASSLDGVAVNLPEPYGKLAEGERPLIFKMSLLDAHSLIDVVYGDHLQALLQLDSRNTQLLNANIALDQPATLPAQPQFFLSGKMANIDIPEWKKAQENYARYTEQLALSSLKAGESAPVTEAADTGLVGGLPFRAQILLDHYDISSLKLKAVDVTAQRVPNAWQLQFTNPIVSGDIYLPNESAKPMQIHLQHLHLTREFLGVEQDDKAVADPLVMRLNGPTIDPSSLPLANVTLDSLFMDNNNYGSWSLQIRPNATGTLFDNIHGSIRGVTVAGIDNPLEGAKLRWDLTDAGSRTQFTGSLSATDIASVLQQWQKPDTLESSVAHFRVDLAWAGDPKDFALKNIVGNTDIWVEKGRFKRNPSVGSDGFLRLMAILNFDSLARRLRLDFSDLYQSGLAYDQISGKVHFDKGIMAFTEPLEVMTPSSHLQMVGSLDVQNETINSHLIATLPVAGNLTFFTAIATGLPAAAGIYLVSKLFKKQVDQATTIGYRIDGDWDNPKMKFDGLFENEDSLRNSAKRKEMKKRRDKMARTPAGSKGQNNSKSENNSNSENSKVKTTEPTP